MCIFVSAGRQGYIQGDGNRQSWEWRTVTSGETKWGGRWWLKIFWRSWDACLFPMYLHAVYSSECEVVFSVYVESCWLTPHLYMSRIHRCRQRKDAEENWERKRVQAEQKENPGESEVKQAWWSHLWSWHFGEKQHDQCACVCM